MASKTAAVVSTEYESMLYEEYVNVKDTVSQWDDMVSGLKVMTNILTELHAWKGNGQILQT